jgi:hypothetical protein
VIETRPETPAEYRNRLLNDIAADPGRTTSAATCPRLERDMEEALLDDWHFAKFLRMAVREDIAPRNPDACKKYGRLCEFFGVCTGAESLEDPDRFVRLENPHSELSLIRAKPPHYGASDWERIPDNQGGERA